MEETKDLLEKQIETVFGELSEYSEEDHDERKRLVQDVLAPLYKLKIEELKVQADYNIKFDQREEDSKRADKEFEYKIEQDKLAQENLEAEMEFKKKQAKTQRLEKWIEIAVQAGITVGGLIAYDIWNKRGLRFEETGTITSPHNRGLIGKMMPKI